MKQKTYTTTITLTVKANDFLEAEQKFYEMLTGDITFTNISEDDL